MSIGQGIAVTPLQMVRAFGALSNGGAMMKPHIIKSYSNSQGDVTSTTETSVVGQPVPEETAKTIVDILEKEVSEGGGTKAMVEGYHFGGKTGTAEKLDTKHGGISTDNTLRPLLALACRGSKICSSCRY